MTLRARHSVVAQIKAKVIVVAGRTSGTLAVAELPRYWMRVITSYSIHYTKLYEFVDQVRALDLGLLLPTAEVKGRAGPEGKP